MILKKEKMKTKLLMTWRILVAAGMLAVLYIVGLISYEYWKEQKNRRERDRYTTSGNYSNAYTFEWDKEKVRLKDAETGKYITPVLDHIYDGTVHDTLAVFFQHNKRGYWNVYTGKIVIPAQFERAWIFSEGLGAVVQDNRLGFIDKTGKIVIPCEYEWRNKQGDHVDYLFRKNVCPAFDSSGRQGLIDKQGQWVLPPEYDHIDPPVNDLRVVRTNGRYGLLDSLMGWVFPLEYDWISLEKQGIVVQKKSSQTLYAYDGKTVLQPFIYDHLRELYYDSGEIGESGNTIYSLSNYMAFHVGNKQGLMDHTGKIIAPAVYEHIEAVRKNLFSCRVAGYSYHVMIDHEGKVMR